jgi:hypothetical protein
VRRSLKWIAGSFAFVLLLMALLLRLSDTSAAPVTVTYFQTHTNKAGGTDAWVRIANPGNRPIRYNIASRECNTNRAWQIMTPPVLAGGDLRARSTAEWPIPVETLGVEWRVRVFYRYRTRGVRSVAHRLDELYERVRGKNVSVRYETNSHSATSEPFVP